MYFMAQWKYIKVYMKVIIKYHFTRITYSLVSTNWPSLGAALRNVGWAAATITIAAANTA